MYQICKMFEFESGHILSKSEDLCRFPHGHSRKVEVVLAAEELDENDMVCNFRWIKLALQEVLDRLDHAMSLNSQDPRVDDFRRMGAKVETVEGQDPTSEVLAQMIFQDLQAKLAGRCQFKSPQGAVYSVPGGVHLMKVRLWETSSSWAEYYG